MIIALIGLVIIGLLVWMFNEISKIKYLATLTDQQKQEFQKIRMGVITGKHLTKSEYEIYFKYLS